MHDVHVYACMHLYPSGGVQSHVYASVYIVCILPISVLPFPQLQTLHSTDQVDTSGHSQSVLSTGPAKECNTGSSPAMEYSSPIAESVVECSSHL